jgi:hypothetical protein
MLITSWCNKLWPLDFERLFVAFFVATETKISHSPCDANNTFCLTCTFTQATNFLRLAVSKFKRIYENLLSWIFLNIEKNNWIHWSGMASFSVYKNEHFLRNWHLRWVIKAQPAGTLVIYFVSTDRLFGHKFHSWMYMQMAFGNNNNIWQKISRRTYGINAFVSAPLANLPVAKSKRASKCEKKKLVSKSWYVYFYCTFSSLHCSLN